VLLAVANVKVASIMAALAQVTQQVGTLHLHTTVETRTAICCPPIVERTWKSTFHESIATEIEESTEFRRIIDGVGITIAQRLSIFERCHEMSRV